MLTPIKIAKKLLQYNFIMCVCVCICTIEIFNESHSSGRIFFLLVVVDHIDNTLEHKKKVVKSQVWI